MRSGKLALVALGIVLLGAVWFAYSVLDSYVNPADTVVNEEVPQIIVDDEGEDNTQNEETPTSDRPGSAIPPVTFSQATTEFQQGDSTYEIAGDLIATRREGEVTLSFSGFSVTSGPDLFVYLVDTADTSNEGVKAAIEAGNFVNLAELKGNIGNQNYEVNVEDFREYDAVSIWCRQFGRNFGHAEIGL
jgi:hypothetical protein